MIDVDIEGLKPGMILEHAVKNHQGVLLLEAGARVTKKNIRIFKSWGVDKITVKGKVSRADGSAGQSAPRTNASDDIQLKEKFADVLDDPVMVEIYKAATRQLDRDSNNDESQNEHS